MGSKRLFDVGRVEELLGRPLRAPEETLVDMVKGVLEEEEEEEEEVGRRRVDGEGGKEL